MIHYYNSMDERIICGAKKTRTTKFRTFRGNIKEVTCKDCIKILNDFKLLEEA